MLGMYSQAICRLPATTRGFTMTNRQLVQLIAGMTRYSIDSDDDKLDDCVATMNRLIQEAQEIVRRETDHDDLPPHNDGR